MRRACVVALMVGVLSAGPVSAVEFEAIFLKVEEGKLVMRGPGGVLAYRMDKNTKIVSEAGFPIGGGIDGLSRYQKLKVTTVRKSSEPPQQDELLLELRVINAPAD